MGFLRGLGAVIVLLVLFMFFPALGGLLLFLAALSFIGGVAKTVVAITTFGVKVTFYLIDLVFVRPVKFLMRRS
jgi:hypothetical protein